MKSMQNLYEKLENFRDELNDELEERIAESRRISTSTGIFLGICLIFATSIPCWISHFWEFVGNRRRQNQENAERMEFFQMAFETAEAKRILQERKIARDRNMRQIIDQRDDFQSNFDEFLWKKAIEAAKKTFWLQSTENFPCVLCLTDVDQRDSYCPIECGHYFHADCLQAWIAQERMFKCPACCQIIRNHFPSFNQ